MVLMLAALATLFPAITCPSAEADANLVSQKIQALGVRDDTLSSDQQPFTWLWDRREQLVLPLVGGLQSTNLESARQCLRILDGVQPAPAVEAALLQISQLPQHPLRAGAILSLCRFASSPRVMNLLKSSWTNAVIFPDAGDRATLAEAAGLRLESAGLLGSVLATSQSEWNCLEIIRRLATNGTPAALSILSQSAVDPRWLVASAARLALAQADPAAHGLTPAQRVFLETTGLGFKETSQDHNARYKKLAALPHDEIRPLLRHMLTTDQGGDAAHLYGLCHDSETLPEIRRRALTEESWRARPFIVAWLRLDESEQPVRELLDKIRTVEGEFQKDDILLAIAESDLPLRRQLAFFRAVRDQLNLSALVARVLARTSQPVVLAALFNDETNLTALGEFARSVAMSPQPEYEKPLRRAVGIIATASPSDLQSSADPVCAILEAAAAMPIKGLDAPARRLMDTPNPPVAIAAARLAAAGGHRSAALALLHRELGSAEPGVRHEAAESLLQIPCANDPERRQREQAVLALLGQPAEDFALRVLTTCAGPPTITQLEPQLDGTNIPIARYAAWVLAQSSNPVVARKALRRLALHALFCNQVYQQGSGIDFEIAPQLFFHQSTGWLSSNASITHAISGVQIPADLILPARLDAAEQTFLIRDYRDVQTSMRQDVLADYFMMFRSPFGHPPADATYLPLLAVAAREDSELHCLYVQGRKVAHFPYRQAAAQNIARLTGKPATYLGLTGESLAADQVPSQPYPGQDLLVARFLLDRIQAAGLKDRPATDRDWSCVGYFNHLIQHLTDEQQQFGSRLTDAILQEARRRQLGPTLKNAGFYLWR